MEAYLNIIIFFVLLTLGYVFGQSLEKKTLSLHHQA